MWIVKQALISGQKNFQRLSSFEYRVALVYPMIENMAGGGGLYYKHDTFIATNLVLKLAPSAL